MVKLVEGAETLRRVLGKTALLYTPTLRMNMEVRGLWPCAVFPKLHVCVYIYFCHTT